MSRRLALIIGNSFYRDKTLAKISSPDADVGALRDVLSKSEIGGFDDVNLVFNSEASVVRKEIFNFFTRKKRDDLLLLYFSGHGVLDENGRLYLAVKDTDTRALRGTAIPARFITDEMDNSRSKRQVLVLDCCHSGAFERGTKGTTGASVGTATVFEGSGFGRVVLTASDATQYAWEGDQIIGKAENSLFTHFLIQGIQTGEADANQDGNITIDEIYDYAYSRILDRTPKQTPGKWSYHEQGELIISKNPKLETPILPRESPEREIKNTKRVEEFYSRVKSKIYSGDYNEAKELLHNIKAVRPGYKDTENLLMRVNEFIREETEKKVKPKQEHEQIAVLNLESEQKVQEQVLPFWKQRRKSYILGFLIHLFTGMGLFYAKPSANRKWIYLINIIFMVAYTLYLVIFQYSYGF